MGANNPVLCKSLPHRSPAGVDKITAPIDVTRLPLHSAVIPRTSLRAMRDDSSYWLIAWIRFDTAWKQKGQGRYYILCNICTSPWTHVLLLCNLWLLLDQYSSAWPQSHLSNARTDSQWFSSIEASSHSTARKVQGRLYWPSHPLLVTLDDSGRLSIESYVQDCVWRYDTFTSTQH